ncbi:glycerate kinase family protein [Chondrinema litorale]|uniref:glycerate kinase family protein n=1 Tax=Chondrinema litorale TaxID=2994555 RepID=UPI00254365F8|nr:glycerate kinase [Chondrinema litorale]UZR93752.1 glycerate kinase [Chondrinema litorale]
MKIIVAPNSFKGSMNALVAANAIEKGLTKANKEFEILKAPIADGGDHFADIMVHALNGKMVKVSVLNPLKEEIEATYGITQDGKTAIIEMAKASGLALIENKKLDALNATSYGTGQLMKHAIENGCTKIILGIGGSATTDAGTGILAALGFQFFNKENKSFIPAGGTIKEVVSIDNSNTISGLDNCEIQIACDVENPFLGQQGAANVFGPQKGASESEVIELENNLTHFAQLTEKQTGKKISNLTHGGAAGGISAGLFAYLDAKLINGTDLVLNQLGVIDQLDTSDVVITAEGKLDFQTLEGKGPYGLALKAKTANNIVIAIGGSIPEKDLYKFEAFDALFALPDSPMKLEKAMDEGERLLENLSFQIGKLITSLKTQSSR